MLTLSPALAQALDRLALDLWSHPELSGQETFAAAQLKSFLAARGFSLLPGLPDLPTSFVAQWGAAGPVIGLLGEYDALPGLSQAAQCAPAPLHPGGPGHGCGHNLLGAGSAGAAVLLKEALEASGTPAIVRFFGCPAEETLTGKVRMAEAGLFDGCALCLSWHPMGFSCVSNIRYAALRSLRFTFRGTAAHAAEAPELGRSALDAVELMNVGANYLREHLPRTTQLHYAITNGGGQPNVVPALAQSWYYIRAPHLQEADAAYARLQDVARGAALMTGTQAEWETDTLCPDTRLNLPLNRFLQETAEQAPPLSFSPEERAFAAALLPTLPPDAPGRLAQYGMEALAPLPLHDGFAPLLPLPLTMSGSSDYSAVSRRVPCGQYFICCCPPGTPAHSWQMTACAGSPLGLRGMRYAAELLAAAALRLAKDPDALAAVRAAFEEASHA